MIIDPGRIAAYAISAGFNQDEAATATAIAMAESSGSTTAHAVNSREDSRGLWQINVKAHPEYANTDLYDPKNNAQAAYAVYKSSGWKAWTTYNGLAYYAALPVAKAAATVAWAAKGTVEAAKGPISDVKDTISQVADIAKKPLEILDFLEKPNTWVRLGKIILGGAITVVGFYLIFQSGIINAGEGAVGKVGKTVVKAVK